MSDAPSALELLKSKIKGNGADTADSVAADTPLKEDADTLDTPDTEAAVTGTDNTASVASAAVVEQKYQHYHSARPAMKTSTPGTPKTKDNPGVPSKKIVFTGYEFLTQDQDIIDYLDAEFIPYPRKGVTKGKFLTTAEADPMEALRRKIKEEVKRELVQEASDKALGITRDMGQNKVAGEASINPLGSSSVAN